jgi:hypothetical protein
MVSPAAIAGVKHRGNGNKENKKEKIVLSLILPEMAILEANFRQCQGFTNTNFSFHFIFAIY